MNEDYFEKYNAYNSEPQNTEHIAENAPEAQPVQEPMTELYGSPEQAAPKATAYQPYTYQPPVHPSVRQQPAVQQPVTQQPAVQQTPTYTNPYADLYTSKPQTTAQPVYQSVDTNASRNNTTYGDDGFYHRSFTRHEEPEKHTESRRETPKKKSGISKGAVAAILIICILFSGAAGFGGSILASKLNLGGSSSGSDALVVHKVEASEVSAGNTMVDKTTSEITDIAASSVVEITTEVVQTSDFYGQYITQGAGSGVIISEDGTIITNNHVIEGAKNITVTLRSGESYEATLIGADEELDVALIKIDAGDKELTVAIVGDSDELQVGDKSVIIGNPLGTLGGSVTEGIVSALDRSIVVDGKTMNLMQTDAAINAGNSGGGMFNGQGELVGIVVAKNYSGEVDNIGFVIPINAAMSVLGDLKQYGYVRGKADTGMTFVDMTNPMYTWYYYGTTESGCYVNSVDSGSNAERAGFEKGDRIISIDGEEISESADIKDIISGKSVGDQVEFKVQRGNRTGTLTLTLEEKIPDSAKTNY